jgi:FkbM family methyltransferase
LQDLGVNNPVYVKKQLTSGKITFEMLLDARGKLEGDLIYYGHYESHLQQLFSELGKDEGVILDIGANIGLHSLYLARVFPRAKVLAFEASPRVFDDLYINLSLNKCNNLEVYNTALGSSQGEMVFYEPSGRGIENRGLGSFNPDNVPEDFAKVTLQVDTVDSLITKKLGADEKVSMIKIDVQGHESQVLGGAAACLSEHRPVIFMELEMANFSEPEQVINEFGIRFNELNYMAHRISDTEPAYTQMDWDTVSSTDKFDVLLLPG